MMYADRTIAVFLDKSAAAVKGAAAAASSPPGVPRAAG
jgi:hypothetical protein